MADEAMHGSLLDSDLTDSSEAEAASMRAEEGDRVARHDGRYWYATFPGFYEPIHRLARMTAAEIARPTALCWGYRAALSVGDAQFGNGSIPVHMLTNAGTFSEDGLSRNRRGDLRKCRRLVEFRRLRDSSLLIEQGHRVFMSAVRRVGHNRLLTEADYRRRVERRFRHGRRLVMAGLVDGRLEGYLDSYAVDGIHYLDEIFIATDALRTGIGTGLYFETIAAALRSGKVHEVCNGLDTPEDPELCHYKESLGFHVLQIPARIMMPAPIHRYLEARRPATHYRLTGTGSVPVAHQPR